MITPSYLKMLQHDNVKLQEERGNYSKLQTLVRR